MNELGPEGVENPELQDLNNRLVQGVERYNERMERMKLLTEGKITPMEADDLMEADEEEMGQINMSIEKLKDLKNGE
jgi:hypothetical protein